MNERRKKTNLTEEEQREKERLVRKKLEPREIKRGTGKLSKDFWDLPRPKDPEGRLLKALLEDRREGR